MSPSALVTINNVGLDILHLFSSSFSSFTGAGCGWSCGVTLNCDGGADIC